MQRRFIRRTFRGGTERSLSYKKLRGQFPGLRLIWADGGCAGKLADWVREEAGCELEIARRAKGERGFTVLPRRWVEERRIGSIPAHAGDPFRWPPRLNSRFGLSPPTQGNRQIGYLRPAERGSIPAHAGEPVGEDFSIYALLKETVVSGGSESF